MINNDREGANRALDKLWTSLFPEAEAEKDKRSLEVKNLMESAPSVFRVSPKMPPPKKEDFRYLTDSAEVKIKPGFKFPKKDKLKKE